MEKINNTFEANLALLQAYGGDPTKPTNIFECTLAILEKVKEGGGGQGGGVSADWVREYTYGKQAIDDKIAAIGGVTIEQVDTEISEKLIGYAKTEDIPSLEGYATEEWVLQQGFLTEHQSLDAYALKTDIPSLEGYALKTDIPSLEGYAKLTDIPTVPTKVSQLENDENYAKKSEIPSLDGYATEEWVGQQGFLKTHQPLKTINGESIVGEGNIEISGEGGVTIEQVDREIDSKLVGYAKEEDIPTVPTKTSELTNDSGFLTEHQDLSNYALKSEIPTVPTKTSELTNDSGFLTEHQSLDEYAKKSEVPNIFVGTQAQWDELTDEQKNTYTLSLITE